MLLLILTVFNCQNAEQKPLKIIETDFGINQSKNDSIGIELRLNEFNNWEELLERTESIVCNDSLPKITLKSDEKIRTVYFRNPCSERFGCILIKQRNTIEIHNDIINKADREFYPLDSLASLLKKDYKNNGQNPRLSDSPEKLLIYISYDDRFENLPNTLNKLISEYEKITDKKDIKIWLNKKFDFPPPPPPPVNSHIEIEME